MARAIVSTQRKEKICPEEMEPDPMDKVPRDADAAPVVAARATEAAVAAPEGAAWARAAAAKEAAPVAAKDGPAEDKMSTPSPLRPARKTPRTNNNERRSTCLDLIEPDPEEWVP